MPWFPNREHSEKQYSQNAMVSEQGAFWKTVLPKCHGFRTLTGSILKNSTPKMPWFANRDDSGPIVKCVICPSLALLAKDSIQLRNRQNQCIMLKFHLFPWDSSKDAILGPASFPLLPGLANFVPFKSPTVFP